MLWIAHPHHSIVYINHPQLTDLRELVLRVHRDRVAASPNGHTQVFPYFEGYCGTPSSALMYSREGGAVRNISIRRRRRVTGNNIFQY